MKCTRPEVFLVHTAFSSNQTLKGLSHEMEFKYCDKNV
jgi:hypothetical protein